MIKFSGKAKDLMRFIAQLTERYGKTATIKDIIEREKGN